MTTQAISEVAQYLSFNLDGGVFALDISRVKEVLEFTAVTKVPQCPDFMRGVINLRGSAVPVVDLKSKFSMGQTDKSLSTCVIITEVLVDGETVVLGAMADAVDEVFNLDREQVAPPPRIGAQLNTDFLMGMGKKGEEFVLMLDIDKVFTIGELAQVVNAWKGIRGDADVALN